MRVDKLKNERQRQIGNVQKQLLNNYFLQKYSSIMNKISNKPEVLKTPISKETKPSHNKINFKSIMQQKKNQTQNSPFEKLQLRQSSKRQAINQKIFEWSNSNDQKKVDNNIDQKIRQKLEESIVKDLYKQSPTKLENGVFNIIQVQRNYLNITIPQQQITQSNINQDINVTYDSEVVEQNNQKVDQENKQYEKAIRQEIKRQFSNRKSIKSSPKKSLEKNKQSQVKSSKVSVQIQIQSPKAMITKKQLHIQFEKQREQSKKGQNKNHIDQIKQNDANQQIQFKGPQIHFTKQMVHPLNHQNQNLQPENSQIEQQAIQFVAPTSNYYKSENQNFVQDTFRYQQKSNSQKDDFQQSYIPQKSTKNLLQKDPSKKSLRSGSKDQNQGKQSSQIQMSFISKLSLISSSESLNIRTSIEKQLYQNELGPYQSGLYSILDLIQKYPKSGPVYAVAQRTLDDRKKIQYRKKQQTHQLQDLKRKTEYFKKKNEVVKYKGNEQSVIKKNKLQILRLVRKLSSKL